MKRSSADHPPKVLDRKTAWGCLTTNLALPGFGSLLAGRRVGYAQAALGLAGFAVTTLCGLPLIVWFFRNRETLMETRDDPVAYLTEVWTHVRWPLLGVALFIIALLWALCTSASVIWHSRDAPPPIA